MIQPKIIQALEHERNRLSASGISRELKVLMSEHPMLTTVQDLIDLLQSRADVSGTLNEYGLDCSLSSVFFQFHMYGLEP
jgi:hypothetical protein